VGGLGGVWGVLFFWGGLGYGRVIGGGVGCGVLGGGGWVGVLWGVCLVFLRRRRGHLPYL